jgi:hypothetical protein
MSIILELKGFNAALNGPPRGTLHNGQPTKLDIFKF